MAYSWYTSYPVSVQSSSDFAFNHISTLYWISLPLLLVTLFLAFMFSKKSLWKWILVLVFFMIIYSQSYFYYTLPTSDAQLFRGLTQNYVRTQSLDPSVPNHRYYQWPSFFVMANVMTTISGLDLNTYEFLLYGVMGFLLVTTLYVYTSRASENAGFLAVASFSMGTFYFLNYQSVPFTLALTLVFVLFMLETRRKSVRAEVIVTLVLYTSLLFVHLFVALFYVLYLLIRYVLKRDKLYCQLFLLTLAMYLVVQTTQARSSFLDLVKIIFTAGSEYSLVVGQTLSSVKTPIDVVAQMISRIVTVGTVVLCIVGFFVLLSRKRIRDCDKALFLTGFFYSAAGAVFYILGSRAIPIAFIPMTLGASYLYESKYRSYYAVLFLILVSLFIFIPLHHSFSNGELGFQTKEEYRTADFMIDKYDWSIHTVLLSDLCTKWYVYPQVEGNAVIEDGTTVNLPLSRVYSYDCIIYSTGLAMNFQQNNISAEESRQIQERFSIIYNSGSTYVALDR